MAAAASLTLLALGCGGKSSNDPSGVETGGTGGAPAAGSGGAATGSGGAAAASGHPARGGSPASAGSEAGGSEASGGSPASSGSSGSDAGAPCVAPDGSVSPELRSCFLDSDCVTRTVPACCSQGRIIGLSRDAVCRAAPPNCSAVDCGPTSGFLSDDGQMTLNAADVRAKCQVGEPGVGLCRTTLADSDTLVCGGVTCDGGELCVHRSARGGPAPRCLPIPADGVCPSDSEYAMDCGGQPGCREILVTPEPQCASIPPGCGAPTACVCLPPELCGAPQICTGVMGRHVQCVDLSP